VSNFDERLLVELRSLVTDPRVDRGQGRRLRRGPRVLLVGGLAAVLAAAAIASVFFLSTGTQAAYAVTRNADGTVTVEIDSLNDAAGLQTKLRAVGVNAVVQYLPEGKMCKQPWFTPAGHDAIGGTTQGSIGRSTDGATRFTITVPPAGITMVISTQTGSGGERALGIGWANGAVPPCQVVDAPAGSGPLGGPPVNSATSGGQG